MGNEAVHNFGAYQEAATIYASHVKNANQLAITNKSGGSVVTGDVVVFDTGTANSFVTTTTAGDLRPVMVVPKQVTGNDVAAQKTILNDERGYVQYVGYCQPDRESIAGGVLVDGAVAKGEYLKTSSTAKKATGTGIIASATAMPPAGAFAIAFASTAGEDIVAALLLGYTFPGLFGKDMSADAPADDNIIRYDAVTGKFELEAGTAGLLEVSDSSPSGAASVDVSSIAQTGGDLIIEGFFLPATDGARLYVTLNNYSGATDYEWASAKAAAGSVTSDNDVADTQFILHAGGVGSGAAEGISFRIEIPNYAEILTSELPLTLWEFTFLDNTATPVLNTGYGGGVLNQSEAINRVTLSFSSGNIAEGHVRIYTQGD